MRYYYFLLLLCCCACAKVTEPIKPHNFTEVVVEDIFTDTVSIRALEVTPTALMYAEDRGRYGYVDLNDPWNFTGGQGFKLDDVGEIKKDSLGKALKIAFRSIASTSEAYFILSIESPARLFKVSKKTGELSEVYTEKHPQAFYDSMDFWNEQEGIAMGDPTEDCLSIIITRNGGNSWQKLACNELPKVVEGEAAFAASDTNIKIMGDKTWIVSGGMKSRIFYAPDKGKTWTVYDTPILQGGPTKGAYTMDFYDAKRGIIYGGDYTAAKGDTKNIAATLDGGVTWAAIGDGANQGYKSCVQYVPNSEGKEIIALGFTGISYSKDGGASWNEISKESFLSFRFLNDTVAFAGGRNRLARLTFK